VGTRNHEDPPREATILGPVQPTETALGVSPTAYAAKAIIQSSTVAQHAKWSFVKILQFNIIIIIILNK